MTDAQVQAAYQQLLALPMDNLEEGASIEINQAPPQAKEEAQAWLRLSQDLWGEGAGLPPGADRDRVAAQRLQALAVVFLLAKGAEPRQLPAIPAPTSAPAAAPESLAYNLVEIIKRSVQHLSAELWTQVQELLTPGAIALMTGVFAGWAVLHAVGIGVAADLILAALGVAYLGWDMIRAARLLYGIVNRAMPPAKDEALNQAARDFAELVVLIGVDAVTIIFLGKAFKKARAKLEKPKAGPEPRVQEKAAQEKTAQEKAAQEKTAQEKSGVGNVGNVLAAGGASGIAKTDAPWGLFAAAGGVVLLVLVLRAATTRPREDR